MKDNTLLHTMCSFKFETVVLIKVGDALLQSQSLKGTIGPKNSATLVRLLLSIFASLLVFPKYRIGSRKLAKVQKRLLASHHYTSTPFLLCFYPPSLLQAEEDKSNFCPVFFSCWMDPNICIS